MQAVIYYQIQRIKKKSYLTSYEFNFMISVLMWQTIIDVQEFKLDKILSKHTYVQSEAECGSCSTNVVYIASVAGGFALLRLALASQALIIIMARKVPFLKHSHTLLNDDRLFIPPWVNITAHTPLMLGSWISTVYGRTISQYIHQDSKLLSPFVCFAELQGCRPWVCHGTPRFWQIS